MEPRILARSEHPISRRDIDANVLKVLYRLAGAGFDAYLVGGGVRDLMLSRKPKDFDVATSAHPQQVRDLFRNSRMIGRRFRLVHVFFGRQNVEVATFRKQAEAVADTDDPLIRLDNTFGTPEEDAFRRDFTVNALFYSPQTFHVIDFPGGVDDLEARLIRTIGDPELRMREDPVRMMRAVRFAAKLGFEIEPATRAAIERHRADLAKASVPRLVEETFKTLGQPEAAHALVLMEELGLLEYVIPILSAHLKARGATLAEQPAVRNMAALGRAIGSGFAPDHSIVLAALMLDLYRDGARVSGGEARGGGDRRVDLLGELARARIRARRHRADAAHPRGVPESGRAHAPHAAPDAAAVLSGRADVLRDDGADLLDRFDADDSVPGGSRRLQRGRRARRCRRAVAVRRRRGAACRRRQSPTPTASPSALPPRRRRTRAPPSQPGDGNGNGAGAPSPSPEPTRRD